MKGASRPERRDRRAEGRRQAAAQLAEIVGLGEEIEGAAAEAVDDDCRIGLAREDHDGYTAAFDGRLTYELAARLVGGREAEDDGGGRAEPRRLGRAAKLEAMEDFILVRQE